MYKGQFQTDAFTVAKTTINMLDWVEPTLYNTGTATARFNGIAIAPGDRFVIGPAGVEMTGTLNIWFPEDAKPTDVCEVVIHYTTLIKPKTCPTPPVHG